MQGCKIHTHYGLCSARRKKFGILWHGGRSNVNYNLLFSQDIQTLSNKVVPQNLKSAELRVEHRDSRL